MWSNLLYFNDFNRQIELKFYLGVKIYTLDREDRVSGETCVTVFHCSENDTAR
jgi:hypothetical protein